MADKSLAPVGVCFSGKRVFPSRSAAKKELTRLKHEYRGGLERLPVRSYECSRCSGFHLTSKDRT